MLWSQAIDVHEIKEFQAVEFFFYVMNKEHSLDMHLKCIKVQFSNKQIIEIKNKLHIDLIFTYWDSEIATEVC